MSIRILGSTAAIAAVLGAGGFAHGYLSDRWHIDADRLTNLETRAAAVPPVAGWVGSDRPLDETSVASVKIFGHNYAAGSRNVQTSVAIGRPGRVTQHTPDYCYPGSGFEQTTPTSKQRIDLPNGGWAEFYTAVFTRKKATGAEAIRIRWAWATDGQWTAPNFPRLSYAREPVLAKLYLVQTIPGDGVESEDEATAYRDFAAAYVAGLNAQLFPRP